MKRKGTGEMANEDQKTPGRAAQGGGERLAAGGSPPVLLLGGQENTLSVTRSLSRHGIRVDVSAEQDCIAYASRFARRNYSYRERKDAKPLWRRLLLEGGAPELSGHVILACADDGIEFLAEAHDELSGRYLLDRNDPALQLAMLDKVRTMELAAGAGVEVPRFMRIEAPADVEKARAHVPFPAVLKPIHSHLFQRAFSRKLFMVNSAAELEDAAARALAKGIAMVLCEKIPGPDDLLSSYYTYIDEGGRSLFRFTKRIIRRWPVNQGLACYHITEWLPETADAGEKFFRGIGFRGLGNVEFKRDVRDGKLKLIECNARFTAAQELLVRAGVDTGWLVYCHVTGRPLPSIDRYREHLRLWYPERDFNAYRELRRSGQLGFLGWLASLAHRQVLPHGDLGDPMPQLVHGWRRILAFVDRRRAALASRRRRASGPTPVGAPGGRES